MLKKKINDCVTLMTETLSCIAKKVYPKQELVGT